MKNRTNKFIALSVTLFFLTAAGFAQTTVFTYQGKLNNGGSAANGNFDFEFRLFDAPTGGTALAVLQRPNVAVANGIFTVSLDFGAENFDGPDRWLEIAVRQPGGGAFTTLAPRQNITSSPYSIKSLKSLDAENLGGVPAVSYLLNNGDGSNLTNVAKLDADNIFNAYGNLFPQITLAGDGQIIAPRLENAAKDPAPAAPTNAGRIYFNTTDKTVRVSDGTNWNGLSGGSATRNIQFFQGRIAESSYRCDQSNIIPTRTVTFNKLSGSSRLRITYKDKAKTSGSANFFTINIEARIDGAAVTPQPVLTIFDAQNDPTINIYFVDEPFSIVGIAENITAGTHTFTAHLLRGANAPVVCFVTNVPYFIEIEEIP
ncbi:MAG: hypothetical protein JSS81_08565 [Acidobacteria bacterium]|nr:hypothetical protein [Acidobacteriota bacterium]